jgi:alginate O-acetyltransferase complex protein AlgJ
MKRRSLKVLLGTGLGVALLPLFNLLLVPSPTGCCSVERLFNMDIVVKGVSNVLFRLGMSVAPSQAVIGRSDRVFLGDQFERALTMHRAQGDQADVRHGVAYARGARRWDTYFRANGVKAFQIMVAPDKASMYPEDLPAWAKQGTPGVTDALFKGIDTPIFLDLRQPLLAVKRDDPTSLFYRYDTHWNQWGAAVGFRAMAEGLGREVPDIKWPAEAHYRLSRMGRRAGGDLADFLRLGTSLADDDPIPDFAGLPSEMLHTLYGSNERVKPDLAADSRVALSHPLRTRNAGALNNKRVLWLTDSFGGPMSRWMHASFSDVVRLHWQDALRNGGSLIRLVDEWRPELVLVTVVERSFRGRVFGSFLDYAPATVFDPFEHTWPAAVFAVSGMQGLARGESDNSFHMTSKAPSLVLSVPATLTARKPVSLALKCLDGAVSVPIQMFWKSGREHRFHPDRSVKFLHVGDVTSVDIRSASGLQKTEEVKEVRLDLRSRGDCHHFRLDGLTLAH